MSDCPFSGTPCPNDKHYEITDMQNGITNNYHVCDECLSKVKSNAMGDIASFINNILGLVPSKPPVLGLVVPKPVAKKSCPDCGWTIRNITASGGKAGCPKCYDFFEQEFADIIKICQHSNIHIGKKIKPKPPHRELMLEVLFKKYNLNLDEAVKKEDYKLAAEIKKEIIDLHAYKKRRKSIIRNLQYALENGEEISVVDSAKEKLDILYKEIENRYFSFGSQ